MQVIARIKNQDAKHAFYNTQIIRNGQKFELKKEEDFDPSYMEWVEKPKPVKAKKKPAQSEDIDLGL